MHRRGRQGAHYGRAYQGRQADGTGNQAASTVPQARANTMSVNATAPLREVRLRPVSSRTFV